MDEPVHDETRIVYSNTRLPKGAYQCTNESKQAPSMQFGPFILLVIAVLAGELGLLVLDQAPYTYWVCHVIGALTIVTVVACICMLVLYEHKHPHETCSLTTWGPLISMLFAFVLHWGYFLERSKMGWSGEKENIIAQ
jgi:hypothetical protein